MVGGKNNGLALRSVMNSDFCRPSDTIPPIPLPLVAMPSLDHPCRGRGDVCLAKPVRVIRCAVDLGELAALIEVGGQGFELG